jgi:choline dehydrogenase-like flavoprotein
MKFDYVIVGGGSAGCVLAARLSEDPAVSVCLLETGGENAGVLFKVPVGVLAYISRNSAPNYAFETVPQDGLNGRRGFQPRGRGLGGSSAINAMIYLRGQRQDYDGWVQAGASGWGWDDVLPYFLKAEHNERGTSDLHSQGGPLNVMDLTSPNPFGKRFVDAALQAGIHTNNDFNGESQEGAGHYQVTQKGGERWSVRRGYLDPILHRKNLTVKTGSQVLKVLLDGRRAIGVETAGLQGQGNQTIYANREVILSAGAFGSPQILMASGIGPAKHLQSLGIPVVFDSQNVGANLQDHLDHIINRRVKSADLFGLSLQGGVNILKGISEWRNFRRGTLTSNFAEAGAFIKSSPELERPDLQLHYVVGMVDDHARKNHLGHGMSCHVCVLRPESRGTVRLASSDTRTVPLIDPKFLADSRDLALLIKGFKTVRKIFAQPAFAPFGGGDLSQEMYSSKVQSDEEIAQLIRDRADTIYHPVGTCRMGSDLGAVVDSELRVRGFDHLRVVDASVMPNLVSGNTNAPTVMIAERAADLIKGRVEAASIIERVKNQSISLSV